MASSILEKKRFQIPFEKISQITRNCVKKKKKKKKEKTNDTSISIFRTIRVDFASIGFASKIHDSQFFIRASITKRKRERERKAVSRHFVTQKIVEYFSIFRENPFFFFLLLLPEIEIYFTLSNERPQ